MAQMRKPGAETASLMATSFLAAAAVIAIAPASARAEVVRPGEEQGLGLTPGSIPGILKKARTDPYAAPPAPGCESIPKEIAELDAVLGPDADAPAQKEKAIAQAGGLITGAVKSLIPHREVVRFITGASKRDKERSQAAMAGWTRRGYLKGMEINLGCAAREAGAPAPADAAAPSAPAEASHPTLQTASTPAVAAPALAQSTEDVAENAAAHAPMPEPVYTASVQRTDVQPAAPPAAASPAPSSAFGSRVLVNSMADDPSFTR